MSERISEWFSVSTSVSSSRVAKYCGGCNANLLPAVVKLLETRVKASLFKHLLGKMM